MDTAEPNFDYRMSILTAWAQQEEVTSPTELHPPLASPHRDNEPTETEQVVGTAKGRWAEVRPKMDRWCS